MKECKRIKYRKDLPECSSDRIEEIEKYGCCDDKCPDYVSSDKMREHQNWTGEVRLIKAEGN